MGKKVAPVDPELIHLISVRILRAHYEVEGESHNSELEISDYRIGLKSETGFNYEINQIRFMIYIKIVGVNSEGEPVGASGEYLLEYSYIVENLNDFVEEDGDIKLVSATLGATIAGISYSTARGIVLDRTQATDFNGVLLPIIDPHRLLDEDSYTEL